MKKRSKNPPPREWSVFDRRQLQIAKAALKLPPVGRVGALMKSEAQRVVRHLTKKYVKNPVLAVFGANPPKGDVMSKRVMEVRYIHTADGRAYKHPFKSGVRMLALPNGAIYLYHPDHRLWNEF